MDDILKIITTEMATLNTNYFYLYNNSSSITYPYVIGEYSDIGYRYEDNSNSGDFILTIFNRGSNLNLINLEKTIKNHFRDLRATSGTTVAHVQYQSAIPIRTDEADLFRIEIHLSINYWEGENT